MDFDDFATVHPGDYPTPSTTQDYPGSPSAASPASGYSHALDALEGSPAPSDAPKKKRKAWGQPVPEIKQILPPRKRAKTAEEKEQRKNERILRNRRAADKSRQRQKAAVAELEAKTALIEQENAALRKQLAQYQQTFGRLNSIDEPQSGDAQTSAQPSFDFGTEASTFNLTPKSSPVVAATQQPTLVATESTPILSRESPTLTDSLVQTHDNPPASNPSQGGYFESMTATTADLASSSDMTHYPAAVMCDLQCQSEVGTSKLHKLLSQATTHHGLSHLLQTIQYLTIFQTFSDTMLSPMMRMFQILAERLRGSSLEVAFPSIMKSFPLIHTLISLPSTATRPAVFRMKLLSRLLACSPLMARLLLVATDRALQQTVSYSDFAEDCDRRWTWSSLMTIKWTILRLEREHRKIRQQANTHVMEAEELTKMVMPGVDATAVVRSRDLWNPPSRGHQSCSTMGGNTEPELRASADVSMHEVEAMS